MRQKEIAARLRQALLTQVGAVRSIEAKITALNEERRTYEEQLGNARSKVETVSGLKWDNLVSYLGGKRVVLPSAGEILSNALGNGKKQTVAPKPPVPQPTLPPTASEMQMYVLRCVYQFEKDKSTSKIVSAAIKMMMQRLYPDVAEAIDDGYITSALSKLTSKKLVERFKMPSSRLYEYRLTEQGQAQVLQNLKPKKGAK
jgi:hypothetical protein